MERSDLGSTSFYNLALSFQTNVPAFLNAINCSFSANVDLDAGTFVTISGRKLIEAARKLM
jgi:hypothetical protein